MYRIRSMRYNNQRILRYFRHHRMASIVAGHVLVASLLGMILLNSAFGTTLFGAFARSLCSSGDQTYRVVSGDTLGAIANRYHTSWQSLATYNRIANANIIYINQHICVQGRHHTTTGGGGGGGGVTYSSGSNAVRGGFNPYPYGQCTWYASQRFYQMHGFFVPWTSNANAWQWTTRAYDYGWRVSSQPSVGAIVDLQPWVQGAYYLGHVGVVEQVLSDGSVIATNMNWGVYYWQVTRIHVTPGYGVTFISY
ncbi:MAG: hypothetical protein NVS4B11_31730 [Ktedonobacteraceae bacterium]